MELSILGSFVQTIGAALLTLTFFYLSRGSGSRVLKAAAWGWLFLFIGLFSLIVAIRYEFPYEKLTYQFFELMYLAGLIVAADRVDHDFPIAKPLGTAAIIALPIAFATVYFTGSGLLFLAVHAGVNAVGWIAITVLILRSRVRGLGRQFSSLLAILTAAANAGYAALFAMSTTAGWHRMRFLPYIGFADLFLEMLFGIGLIIWAMEDTEARLAMVHARTVGETQRTKRRAQLDPLTEAHNRFYLEEIRPQLTSDQATGSIILIDVDGLKTINDKEGHEDGDKAIWTIATAIKKLVRGNDFLIRWGGDEFLVILPGMDEGL
ncbi:MAG TPA: GGDEF domain-containing protein, partial [Thermoanaerobaculia bacterium]|nr:GGDEF domain-containing protein [Thermoanaerobaculia bacterium]